MDAIIRPDAASLLELVVYPRAGDVAVSECSRFSAMGKSLAVWNLFKRRKLLGALLDYWRQTMNGLIYLIGLIVVIMFILSFIGLR